MGPVGFQNSATGPDLGLYAARSYSLMRPVLVENSVGGLTLDFTATMIWVRVRETGLPAAGDRGVVARAAGAVFLVQGRGDTRASARGRGVAPGDSQAASVLDRTGGAGRARPGPAERSARTADRDPGHAAALAPPHGRGEMAPAQATGDARQSRTSSRR